MFAFPLLLDIMRIFVSLSVSYALLMGKSVLMESSLTFKLLPVSVLFMSYIISFAMMVSSSWWSRPFSIIISLTGIVPMCLSKAEGSENCQ